MRLKTLKSRIATLAPRLTQASPTREARIRGSVLQDIRARIFRRDCGLCRCAGCRKTERVRLATQVDHVLPVWAGGRETDENRQAIAAECHRKKTTWEGAQRARFGSLVEPWPGE